MSKITHKLTRREQGFTIIEVMIVLAIAALILLAVFLAIPNLQRASRNSGRKADAGRIGTAATNFAGNNNGSLPTTAADGTTITTDAGTLSQYTLAGSGAGGTACAAGDGNAAANANKLWLCKGAAVKLNQPAANTDLMVLAVQAQCGSGAGTIAIGTARQMALFYTQETSSSPTWACLNL
jgi:prepilin-type N-terminal cleavage/methylation domain-containing protein